MKLRVVVTEESSAHPFTIGSAGERVAGNEVPERIPRILEGLLDGGATVVRRAAPSRTRAERLVAEVHEDQFLTYLRDGVPTGQETALDDAFAAPGLAQETPITADVWSAALNAATASVHAAELVARGDGHAYALVRPPGHHAGPRWHGGYCFLNNAVVAAHVLREEGAGRVGILDVDYHLGNGTLACVEDDPALPYASVHSTDPSDFPYRFTPGPGLFGAPTDPGVGAFLGLVRKALSHLRRDGLDALVVSVGYDVVLGDPHGSWSLPPEVFGPVAGLVVGQLLPTVFVQEGGYGLESLSGAARALALEVSTR